MKYVIDPMLLDLVMNDAINVFVREVLIKKGLIPSPDYLDSQEMLELQAQTINEVAARWKCSEWVRKVPDTAAG